MPSTATFPLGYQLFLYLLRQNSCKKPEVLAFNKQVDNEFTALFGFLARFGSEVGGRAASQPGEEISAQLLRFARGECSAQERVEICEILRQRRAWHRWMVNRIKAEPD